MHGDCFVEWCGAVRTEERCCLVDSLSLDCSVDGNCEVCWKPVLNPSDI